MLGESRARQLAERMLARSSADETEVVIQVADEALTRLANSYIHQNVARRNVELRVRVGLGGRIGVAAGNDLGERGLVALVERAVELAGYQPVDPFWPGLPQPVANGAREVAFSEATAACTPEYRAKAVGVICSQARQQAVNASGALSTVVQELGVANSHGLWVYQARTVADCASVCLAEGGGSGYAAWVGSDISHLDAHALATEAIGKALRSRHPSDVPPTDYTVVLEPYAVADMVRFLAYWMNGRALLDKRSFMSDRIGQSVTGANVSLWDDGTDPAGLPIAFDFEGVAKQRAVLVDKGVARGVVWDRRTAAEAGEGHASTGHALPAPNTFGPLPLNLFMAPRPGGSGERVSAQAEELVAGVANGLLVTRFNYVRAVHDARTVITGLTRDGTFAVRQGEVAHAVKNLRFTQSILGALGRVVDMSTGSKLLVGWIGALSVPALVIEGFRFTGATDF